MTQEKITSDIIHAAIEVHKNLGAGLLEGIYERALEYELTKMGYKVSHQVYVPVVYKGIHLYEENDPCGLRLDLIVNDSIVLELKSVEQLERVHFKQLTTYLKLLNLKLGYLFNFNVGNLMHEGFGKVVISE